MALVPFLFQRDEKGELVLTLPCEHVARRQAFAVKRSSWNAHPCWHLPLGSYY